MLQSNDIGVLFATLQAAYGNAWPHKADAIPVWFRALGGFEKHDVQRATATAISQYPKFPPSLGQFIELVSGPPKRHSTYIAAPNRPKALRIANYALLQVLVERGGVSKRVLGGMVDLKNALLEDFAEMDKANVSEMKRQLLAMSRQTNNEVKI